MFTLEYDLLYINERSSKLVTLNIKGLGFRTNTSNWAQIGHKYFFTFLCDIIYKNQGIAKLVALMVGGFKVKFGHKYLFTLQYDFVI
jgi:hypothetical protein